MKIRIIAVGKLKKSYLKEGCDEYLKRLKGYVPVEVIEVKEQKGHKKQTPEYRKAKEGERIAALIDDPGHTVALDSLGKKMNTIAFSKWMRKNIRSGSRQLTFIIGGSDGLSSSIKKKASLILSFSPLTFPHEMFRMIFLEQLYRIFTVIRSEPYHK